MGFNMFLADDLVAACTQRFKRSKIDGPTYRRALHRPRAPYSPRVLPLRGVPADRWQGELQRADGLRFRMAVLQMSGRG